MIVVTPEAARELRGLAASGEAAILKLDAKDDGEGGYDCSVGLVDSLPPDARVEQVDGISVAFCGAAESIFAGSVLGLNADGELTLEMAEGDCDSCGHDGCCGDGGCENGGSC